jgi:hypothetical protein
MNPQSARTAGSTDVLSCGAGSARDCSQKTGARLTDPSSNGFPCRLGNLELDGSLSFLLHYDRPRCHGLTVAHVPHSELDQIAGTEFAVSR